MWETLGTVRDLGRLQEIAAVLIRYGFGDVVRRIGLATVADRVAGIGPLGGLDALASACSGEWLLTVPVDVVNINDCLLRRLSACGGQGAWVVDDDGPQPLVALWPVARLRPALAEAINAGELAVHVLQAKLGMAPLRLEGVRFGNLNTPQDLANAGIETG